MSDVPWSQWLPWSETSRPVPIAPDQLTRALRNLVTSRRPPSLWPSGTGRPYHGQVAGPSFRLRRSSLMANAFRPIIVGQSLPAGGPATATREPRGAIVRYVARPTLASGLFLALWVTLAAAAGIALFIQEWTAGRSPWLGLAIPLAMAASVYAFWVHQVHRAADDFATLLANVSTR